MVGESSVEFRSEASVEASGEASAVDAILWTQNAVEGVLGKNDMIERRLMNQSIELHETMRQIKI